MSRDPDTAPARGSGALTVADIYNRRRAREAIGVLEQNIDHLQGGDLSVLTTLLVGLSQITLTRTRT